MSECKTTVVSYEEFTNDEFKPPAKFYVKTALGMYKFYHTNDRALAQKCCDEEFGKGHYLIAAAKLQKSTKGLTARANLNSKSRAGMRKP